MKKILIVSHAMELGGAESALLGLLENIDTNKYQVDLFLLRHQGELIPFIPKNINLLPENSKYSCMAVPISAVFKKRHFRIAIGRTIGKIKAKKRNKELGYTDSDIALEYSHKYTVFAMPMISNETYDLAISFLTPHYYVTEKVHAKKKIAWIHTDYSVVQVDKDSQLKMWEKYDRIGSISEKAAESFLGTFPELREKVEVIENILPLKYIESKADEFEADEEMPTEDCFKLLSVGRFCTAKNFDNVPEICRNILQNGMKVKWYLIGYGGSENLIREKITEFGMQENVIVLGKKSNPYPYIKACNLYVQPSRYEGKCVSVIEAQALHKPVVITNYATSASQLEDGVDGVIVPLDNEGCANGIIELLKHPDKMKRLSMNCSTRDYTNSEEIHKIYNILEASY